MTKAPAYDPRSLLTHRLLVLSNKLGMGAVRLYAGRFGVPLAEWRLLAALMTGEEATVSALAAALGTDKGWISRTASALINKGLAKSVVDATDGRRFQLRVTPAGRALYERILPAALERHRQLVSVMTSEEQRVLDDLLSRLLRQAEHLGEAQAPEQNETERARESFSRSSKGRQTNERRAMVRKVSRPGGSNSG